MQDLLEKVLKDRKEFKEKVIKGEAEPNYFERKCIRCNRKEISCICYK